MSSPERHREPQCILCGRCLEVCPLLAATGREELSPRAKLHTLRRLAESPGGLDAAKVADLAGLCLSCGRCAGVCPQGMDVPETVGRVRGAHPGFRTWLWRHWIGSARWLWPAAAGAGAALPGTVAAKGHPRKLAVLGADAPFAPWLVPEEFGPCPDAPKTVLFSGCLARSARRAWSAKAAALLDAMGCAPAPEPDWACCGQTLGHAGAADAEARAVRRNVDAWRAAGRPRIVVFCMSCAHGLSAYADKDAAGFGQDEASAWTAAVTPLSRLLGRVRFSLAPGAPERVLYHRPCHARPHDADRDWLADVLGERLHPGDGTDCCGMGGVMQLGAPELSAAVADRLWARRAPREGDAVLTGCSGCMLQLAATAPQGVRVGHWLDAVRA